MGKSRFVIDPVGEKLPLAGSKSSALESGVLSSSLSRRCLSHRPQSGRCHPAEDSPYGRPSPRTCSRSRSNVPAAGSSSGPVHVPQNRVAAGNQYLAVQKQGCGRGVIEDPNPTIGKRAGDRIVKRMIVSDWSRTRPSGSTARLRTTDCPAASWR